MKIEMNMCKCNINKMMFMDNLIEEAEGPNPCVIVVSETLSCNVLEKDGETGIIIQEKFILMATKWNVMDVGNEMVMIKEFDGDRFWTAILSKSGDPLRLMPASDDPMKSQIFRKTVVDGGFQLESDGLLILLSTIPPKEGVILITGDQSVALATFNAVNANAPDEPC